MTDGDTSLPAASLLLDEQLCFAVYAAQRAATAAADGGCLYVVRQGGAVAFEGVGPVHAARVTVGVRG
ncbi:hypothetical protein ACFVRH_17165, partial [Streptomyces sp. NPDC057909]